jgi:hypothetical protein
MPDLIRARHQQPESKISEYSLTERDGEFLLIVREEETHVDADNLASALAKTPEITSFNASDHLTFTCSDDRARASLIAALVDLEPERDFDDARWPNNAATPSWDEWPAAESVLRRRWVEIDGAEHHPIALSDRTRMVRYDADSGEINAGEVLVTAIWSFDSEVMSSFANGSLALVGGDVLLSQRRGDEPGASVQWVTRGTLPGCIADWLAANTYAPAAILSLVGTPGLDAEVEGHQVISIDPYLQEAVLGHVPPSGVARSG